jgi:hypothetical protein
MSTALAMCQVQVKLRLGVSRARCVDRDCTKDHIAEVEVFLPSFRDRLQQLPEGEYRDQALRAHDEEVMRRLERAAIDPVLEAAAAAIVLAKRQSEREVEVTDYAARVAETKYWEDEDRRLE